MGKYYKYLIFLIIGLSSIVLIRFLLIAENKEFKVEKVVDGDTVILENGKRVRLLGINSPEKGQKFYEEAKTRLKKLVEGKKVILKEDFDDEDKYGRWLRYVYIGGELVNAKLVREGYATPYMLQNIKYKTEIQNAWHDCLDENLRICGNEKKCDNTCIGISYINWDADGNDCKNLNGEYVVFKNFCNISCNLTKWKILDSDGNYFLFPEFELKPYSKLTIYTGDGKNTKNKLYWNNSGKGCNAVWNNDCDGDIVYLVNSLGEQVFEYKYQGFC